MTTTTNTLRFALLRMLNSTNGYNAFSTDSLSRSAQRQKRDVVRELRAMRSAGLCDQTRDGCWVILKAGSQMSLNEVLGVR